MSISMCLRPNIHQNGLEIFLGIKKIIHEIDQNLEDNWLKLYVNVVVNIIKLGSIHK